MTCFEPSVRHLAGPSSEGAAFDHALREALQAADEPPGLGRSILQAVRAAPRPVPRRRPWARLLAVAGIPLLGLTGVAWWSTQHGRSAHPGPAPGWVHRTPALRAAW